jgi:hypothetical protein
MTHSASLAAASTPRTTPPTPVQPALPAEYQAGVCNIGPEEIARRRRAGHVGLVITVALLLGFVLTDLPPIFRLVLFLPAASAASGYLQAWLKFCAGFGSIGVYNFGRLGQRFAVPDDGARARDRRRARQIGLAAGLIGLVVAVVAVLLPV